MLRVLLPHLCLRVNLLNIRARVATRHPFRTFMFRCWETCDRLLKASVAEPVLLLEHLLILIPVKLVSMNGDKRYGSSVSGVTLQLM